LKEQSFIAGTGILATKFLALNIIPIGSLAGGMLLIYLFELFGFKSEKFNDKFQLIGFLILLVIIVVWTVGFIAFIWKSIGN